MDAKAGARERFATVQDSLLALSHRIHANPELGFEEEKASTWIADMLADARFTVQRGICDLPTADNLKVNGTEPFVLSASTEPVLSLSKDSGQALSKHELGCYPPNASSTAFTPLS